MLSWCIIAASCSALKAPTTDPPVRASSARRAASVHAVLSADPDAAAGSGNLLGEVLSSNVDNDLVVVRPEARELARVGTLLAFGGGGRGVVIAERCGLYFAKALDGALPQAADSVVLRPQNLTVSAWDEDSGAEAGSSSPRLDLDRKTESAFALPGHLVARPPVSQVLQVVR